MSKTLIIAGANGGIGQGLSEQISAQKTFDNQILTARDKSSIQGLADSVNADTYSLDVLDKPSLDAFVNEINANEDIKGVAYCIGSIVLKPFKSAKDDEFLETFRLNVSGAVSILRATEKALKKNKGSVVLFSTVAVQQGFSNHTVIATAKGAIEALTRSLAAEWAPHVRVNCIAPSLTNTSIAEPLLASEQMAKGIAQMHPIQRIGEPADIASMAAFLMSEQSGWITGQVIHVDGGRGALRVKG